MAGRDRWSVMNIDGLRRTLRRVAGVGMPSPSSDVRPVPTAHNSSESARQAGVTPPETALPVVPPQPAATVGLTARQGNLDNGNSHRPWPAPRAGADGASMGNVPPAPSLHGNRPDRRGRWPHLNPSRYRWPPATNTRPSPRVGRPARTASHLRRAPRRRRHRAIRLFIVNLWIGTTILGLDLVAGVAVVQVTGRPDAAILLNCLLGALLAAFALHPSSPRAHRRLVRTLARRRTGRILLRLTSAPRSAPGTRTRMGHEGRQTVLTPQGTPSESNRHEAADQR